jgi:hypothetical protein
VREKENQRQESDETAESCVHQHARQPWLPGFAGEGSAAMGLHSGSSESGGQAGPYYANLGQRLEAARAKHEALWAEQARLLEKARQAASDADRLCRELRGACRHIAACNDTEYDEEEKGTQ